MTKFIKQGNDISILPKGLEYDLEPGKVYDLNIREIFGRTITDFKLNGEINMPSTVYQTKKDKVFVKRVLHNYFSTDKNTTGVLLTGDKGTGKSVTAKIIASKANLPIIIINPKTEDSLLESFFKEFDTPVCILLDEVDKNFDTSKMLTFLDGMHKTAKKLVIMTANNEDNLSSFIKNRCSRIRYYRHYDMFKEAKEYAELICEQKGIDDKDSLVDFIIKNIKYPSIDNISSFIDEVIFTKDWGLTYKEVLEFMNINVGELIDTSDSEDHDEEIEYDTDDEGFSEINRFIKQVMPC